MTNKENVPHGYIYRATNRLNRKNYIGQTITSRWEEDKTPIEERWKEEIQESYRNERKGEQLRSIERAIIKYGPENFDLEEQDKAYSQEDLDEKETDWIKEHDSMNPDKGYNMREGGLAGRLSQEVKDNISNIISKKYQNEPEYYDKQVSERRERAQDPEWVGKMTEINQEIARRPETQEKMSKSISEKWQEREYQENVSQGVTGKWQESKYRARQFKARVHGKREIENKTEFLKDIQEMKKVDLNSKYEMDGKSINKRIKEMLGHRGVNNFSEAKGYLKDKNLDKVLMDIKARQSEQSHKFEGKKEISDKREFLADIQHMKAKDISQKYNMNRSTVNKRIQEMLADRGVNNYTEAKNYLKDKNLDKVVKDIKERMKDESKILDGKTIISDKKEFLEDILKMQKNEMDHKYGMDAKTVNNKIKEMLGHHGVRNYTDAKEYLRDKNIDDVVKDIEERDSGIQGEKLESDEKIKDKMDDMREKGDREGKDKESSEEKSEAKREEPLKEDKEQKEGELEEEQKEDRSGEKSGEQTIETQTSGEMKENEIREEIDKIAKEGQSSSMEASSERLDNDKMEPRNNSFESWIIFERVTIENRPLCDGFDPIEEPHDDKGLKKPHKDEDPIVNPPVFDAHEGKDYDRIEKEWSDKEKDYVGITDASNKEVKDYSNVDKKFTGETGKDFDGIDEPRSEKAKDYDYINEVYGESGGGG